MGTKYYLKIEQQTAKCTKNKNNKTCIEANNQIFIEYCKNLNKSRKETYYYQITHSTSDKIQYKTDVKQEIAN